MAWINSVHRNHPGRPFRGQNGQLGSPQAFRSTISGSKRSTRFTAIIRVDHFEVKTVNSVHRKHSGRPFPKQNGRLGSPQAFGSTISRSKRSTRFTANSWVDHFRVKMVNSVHRIHLSRPFLEQTLSKTANSPNHPNLSQSFQRKRICEVR